MGGKGARVKGMKRGVRVESSCGADMICCHNPVSMLTELFPVVGF